MKQAFMYEGIISSGKCASRRLHTIYKANTYDYFYLSSIKQYDIVIL